jgi:hypothetical protein
MTRHPQGLARSLHLFLFIRQWLTGFRWRTAGVALVASHSAPRQSQSRHHPRRTATQGAPRQTHPRPLGPRSSSEAKNITAGPSPIARTVGPWTASSASSYHPTPAPHLPTSCTWPSVTRCLPAARNPYAHYPHFSRNQRFSVPVFDPSPCFLTSRSCLPGPPLRLPGGPLRLNTHRGPGGLVQQKRDGRPTASGLPSSFNY